MGRATSDLRALLYGLDCPARQESAPCVASSRSSVTDKRTLPYTPFSPRLINSRSVQKKTVREGGAAA